MLKTPMILTHSLQENTMGEEIRDDHFLQRFVLHPDANLRFLWSLSEDACGRSEPDLFRGFRAACVEKANFLWFSSDVPAPVLISNGFH